MRIFEERSANVTLDLFARAHTNDQIAWTETVHGSLWCDEPEGWDLAVLHLVGIAICHDDCCGILSPVIGIVQEVCHAVEVCAAAACSNPLEPMAALHGVKRESWSIEVSKFMMSICPVLEQLSPSARPRAISSSPMLPDWSTNQTT